MKMTQEELERKLQDQAAFLGGGWRIEQGFMPVIILNIEEADRVIQRLKNPKEEATRKEPS